MKAKFGSIVTDARGKIGGHVASKNRAGAYFRTKTTPVNPKSSYQTLVRNRFGVFSSGWRGLTQSQRDAWNAAVRDWQKTNIFGDLVSPSGIQLYQRINNNLVSSGASAITTPAAPKGVLTVILSSVTAAVGTPAISAVLSGAVPANTRVKVYATAPVSAGKNYIKNQLRLISTLAPAATSPVNLLTAWQSRFGSISGAGSKLFVGMVFVDVTSGQESPMQIVSCIIAA